VTKNVLQFKSHIVLKYVT